VNIIDIKEGDNGAPRDFRIYEPTGATGLVPVVHFQHGFQLKYTYYDDMFIHLSSHGFIVVSGQSEHSLMGGDTTIAEADKVITFIDWIKINLAAKIPAMTPDFDNFGVSGHSRGGKVTNRILNKQPAVAKAFFGVDPVDSPPPVGGSSDPASLDSPVQFQGKSMFLGAELGPHKNLGQACAPENYNSVNFYFGFPSPSRHIIAAGVGHMDMVDEPDLKACGQTCSLCVDSGNNELNTQFRTYAGGLMAAFFSSSLKGKTEYETLLNDFMSHPFLTKVSESK
jgi:chlorophyllase